MIDGFAERYHQTCLDAVAASRLSAGTKRQRPDRHHRNDGRMKKPVC